MAGKKTSPTQFTRESAERIARVVRAAELSYPEARPLEFTRVASDRIPKQVRAATFTGSWFQGSTKTVTFTNQPTATVSVQNLTMSLPFTATQNCIVGKDGTSWYLVSAADEQVRAATFTGSWFQGSTKTVTLKDQPAATVNVQNLTISLPFTDTQDCIVGKVGTSWYLVSALDDQVKRGTFSAPWTKATQKTVSLLTGQQVTAVNDYVTISGSGAKKCSVARDGTAWHLIAAECS